MREILKALFYDSEIAITGSEHFWYMHFFCIPGAAMIVNIDIIKATTIMVQDKHFTLMDQVANALQSHCFELLIL